MPGLIDAFDELGRPDAHLLIAGSPEDDEMEASLQRRVEKRDDVSAVFEFIPNDRVQEFMNAGDVIVLPYRDIMTSGSVLLAMSFARPVVAPEMGCIPAITDDDGGFLYDPNDPEGLVNALRAAYEEGGRVREMGERNYCRETELSWDGVGRDTVDIYERATDR